MQARAKQFAMVPIKSVEDALQRNVELGVIMGLRLLIELPTVTIKDRQEEIDQILEDIRNGTREPDSNEP